MSRPRPHRLVGAVVVGLLLAGTAGCAEPDGDDAGVDVDTPELRQLKDRAGIAPCASGPTDPATQLPDVTLPCLGGGPEVALASVAGPAVLNLWAQWCGPCAEELPLFQRLHEDAGDRVAVLGIDWQDTQPGRALELARLSGVTYPLLADPQALVADAWRVNGLPITVFVDAGGETTVHRGVVADYTELAGLVEDHTGVTVTAG